MSKVIIIGAGAAGIMAAVSSALNGHTVSIYEKNDRIGRKLYITGKGRCNITNAADMKTIMENVVNNSKFLYSAFKQFDNQDVVEMLENAGCPTKVERGNRVFPVSDKSSDVIKAFQKILSELSVEVNLKAEVNSLIIEDSICKGIKLADKSIYADAVIVATGGRSYPGTGSTGDGYRFAKNSGHKVGKLYPSLVPFTLEEKEEIKKLQGLSLKNVAVEIYDGDKNIYKDFGEMLFTHFGISGPTLISASSYAVERIIDDKKKLRIVIDLKPALDNEKLDARLLRDFESAKNKQLKNVLPELLPLKLIPEVLRQADLKEDIKICNITRKERLKLLYALKNLSYTIDGVRGFEEAIITKGGVDVSDINPKTMESRLITSLYFVGEVLDIDALTGGYNLQVAWTTGYVAGGNIEYV
jgi:flavoprotein family protein